MALTYEDVLNQQAKGQKDTALQQKTAADLEIERQAKQLQGDVNTQRGNISAVGLLGQENKRIVDQIQGYGGSGAGVQHQDIIASGTQSRLGQVDNAYATSLGDFANKRVDNTTAYNNNLSTIDSNITQAKATYFYEQQQAKIAQDQADAKAYANANASVNDKWYKDNLGAVMSAIDNNGMGYFDKGATDANGKPLKSKAYDPVKTDAIINQYLENGSITKEQADRLRITTGATQDLVQTAQDNNDVQESKSILAKHKADVYSQINSMVKIDGGSKWEPAYRADYRARIKSTLDGLYGNGKDLTAQGNADYQELLKHFSGWFK